MTGPALRKGRRFAATCSLGTSVLIAALLVAPLGGCRSGCRTDACAPICCAFAPPPPPAPPPSPPPTASGGVALCGAWWPGYTGNPQLGSAAHILAEIDRVAEARLKDPRVTDPEARKNWRAVRREVQVQRRHGQTCTRHTCEQLYRRVQAARLLASVGDAWGTFVALSHAD